jgi:hypothetical protein
MQESRRSSGPLQGISIEYSEGKAWLRVLRLKAKCKNAEDPPVLVGVFESSIQRVKPGSGF